MLNVNMPDAIKFYASHKDNKEHHRKTVKCFIKLAMQWSLAGCNGQGKRNEKLTSEEWKGFDRMWEREK